MKKVLLAGLLLLFVSSFAFAQMDNRLSMIGTIVDFDSMSKHKDDMTNFLTIYTKDDALKPEAVKSGYGIFLTDGFMRFDKASNAMVEDFLKKADSTLQVLTQVYIEENNVLSLVSIQNK
jgi:hypothetical protein